MCVGIPPAHMSVWRRWILQNQSHRQAWASRGCWDPNPGPLKEPPAPSTTEPLGWFLETGSHCIVQVGCQPTLPPSSEYWDYSCGPLHPARDSTFAWLLIWELFSLALCSACRLSTASALMPLLLITFSLLGFSLGPCTVPGSWILLSIFTRRRILLSFWMTIVTVLWPLLLVA